MSNQSTMIIITSDQNLIHQCMLNQNSNTYPITLNGNTTIEVNIRNDQLPKRSIDTIDSHQPKSVKTRKKSLNLICTICSDRAIGYNYAVVSCASCKAFFHRNGQHDSKRFKCLTNHGQCPIDVKISRRCYRCRLEKCLSMGMRRDLILTQKRKTLLNEQDWTKINQIQSIFLSILDKCEDISDGEGTSELIDCLQLNNNIALQIIEFCRSLDDFEKLNANDRFILIKYNLTILYCLSTCSIIKQTNDHFNWTENDEDKQSMYHLCNQSEFIYQTVINVGINLKILLEQDDILLPLLLIIVLFSKCISRNENEPILNDSLAVYRVQSYYTQLVWNYLIEKHGEMKACIYFTRFVSIIFQAQLAAKLFRDFLGNEMRTLDTVEQIVPLMQTILHIS